MDWFDSHCHLPPGPECAARVAEAKAAGVTRMVSVGTDATETARAIEAARAHEGVSATAGLHPHDAHLGVETILPFVDAPEVVAIGECGLDYHYDHSPRAAQREVFAAQISLAHEQRLALVIHTREAWDDTFDILRAQPIPERVIFHCFTGGPDQARLALEIGAYLSFSGMITFKTADEIRSAAIACPEERLLVETDAPFLAPTPHRGKTNRPAWVALVGSALAGLRGVPIGRIAAVTTENAERVFARNS